MESMERLGVPASSLSQLRGPWPKNLEDPCSAPYKPYQQQALLLTAAWEYQVL